jgi:hypothetical protein
MTRFRSFGELINENSKLSRYAAETEDTGEFRQWGQKSEAHQQVYVPFNPAYEIQPSRRVG